MTDVIINNNNITIEVVQGDLTKIDSQAPIEIPVVQTEIDETQLFINESPFSQQAQSAKEISGLYECGETISANKFVYLADDNKIYLGNSSVKESAQVIGVATQAGSSGDKIKVLIFGRLDDAYFVFSSGDSMYLTTLGNVSTTAPVSGYVKEVGQGLQVGSIFVNVKSAIKL